VKNHYFPQSDLFLTMPADIVVAAIEQEINTFKLNLKHAEQHTDCISDRQELIFYLNTVVRDLQILNRAFPPPQQNRDILL
jgi:hypothetical protein